MPFRQRARNLFKTRSRSDSTSKASSDQTSDRRPSSNVYGPDEPMPRPKYRQTPKKEHKEKLEAFSFSDAWRRRSFQSAYSPMGTRAPSRRNSILSRKSRPSTRQNSVSESTPAAAAAAEGPPAPRPRETHGAAAGATMTPQPEQDGDDDDVANGASPAEPPPPPRSATTPLSRTDSAEVGLARAPSASRTKDFAAHHYRRPSLPSSGVPLTSTTSNTTIRGGGGVGTAYDHRPFSEQDLSLALQRSHLTITA